MIRKLKEKSLMLLFLLGLTSLTYGQISISGTVSNSTTGATIPGVNIVVKGTINGTITDLDGNYTIEVPGEETVLVFSYVGFLSEEILVGTSTTMNVSLIEDITALEDVIVIGYGARKKSEITGAVGTVNDKYIENSTSTDPAVALQGSVAGVTVTQQGTPGGEAEILIRGLGTINDNKPLIIIDGIPGTRMPPQSQIENIQILKDAASGAIYGSQGANGVILISTKQGRKNSPAKFDFSVRTGYNYTTDRHDLLIKPEEYAEMLKLELENSNSRLRHSHIDYSGEIPVLNPYLFPVGAQEGDDGTEIELYDQVEYPITRSSTEGTDWLDEMSQFGLVQDYNLTVTGGSEKGKYAFSANYLDKEGMLKYTGFNRISIRSNTEVDLKDWLTIGQQISFTRRDILGAVSNNTIEGILKNVYEISPLLPVYDEGGNFAGAARTGEGPGPSPVADLYYNSRGTNLEYLTLGNVYAEISPVAGLKIKTQYGVNYNTSSQTNPVLPRPDLTNGRTTSRLQENRNQSLLWRWTNTLNYTKTMSALKFDILVGSEASKNNYNGISGDIENFYTDKLDYLLLTTGTENLVVEAYRGGNSYFSLFGRTYLSYANKYMAEVSFRNDKSSRFSENNRQGLFPSVSLAWTLSEESFMMGTSDWLTNLKVRSSWGRAGNNKIGDYNSYSTYGTKIGYTNYDITGSNNSVAEGFALQGVGDMNARWETMETMNAAFDVDLWEHLNISVDLWQKKSKDMLYAAEQPAVVVGAASEPSVNIGTMENKGVDITAGYRGSALNNELRYFANATFSIYRNKVTKLSANEQEYIDGLLARSQTYTRTESDHAFPEFYGYKIDGIFQDSTEAANWTPNGTYNAPGKLRFMNVVEDSVIDDKDRTYIGSPHPDWTAGLNLGVEYKGFDFTVTFYAVVGNEIVNYGKRFRDYAFTSTGPRSPERLYESWGSPYLENNKEATLPIALNAVVTEEQRASNLYIEDGSYLRMQNIQIGYNLPRALLEKISVSNLRIYLMANNLWTLTSYTGLNPEVTLLTGTRSDGTWGQSLIDRGVDISNWPVAKELLIGINLTF